jgi:hypothetical protein
MLAYTLLAAATERAFADDGHTPDFINKAFECLDLIDWEHATALLPTVIGQMVGARGAEESTSWRQPVDLVALCDETIGQLRSYSPPAAASTVGQATRPSPESCSARIRRISLTLNAARIDRRRRRAAVAKSR